MILPYNFNKGFPNYYNKNFNNFKKKSMPFNNKFLYNFEQPPIPAFKKCLPNPKIEEFKVKNATKSCKNTCNELAEYFEIFGFKLYYDDLLIIGLILLLFNEGVNDQLLIISLVLLIGD